VIEVVEGKLLECRSSFFARLIYRGYWSRWDRIRILMCDAACVEVVRWRLVDEAKVIIDSSLIIRPNHIVFATQDMNLLE
jgi:hypothetical protein